MHMKGSIFDEKIINRVRETVPPGWQSSETRICSPFIPDPSPTGKAEVFACLGASSGGFVYKYFTCYVHLLIQIHHQPLGRHKVDAGPAHLLHLTLAPFALIWTGRPLCVSKSKAIKKNNVSSTLEGTF